jgi:tetratricopeptide (TPR) repeat protein
MSELSAQAKRVLMALTGRPDEPADIDLARVAAQLDGDEDAARHVFAELMHSGAVIEQGGRHKIVDAIAANAINTWLIERAVLACRKIAPFDRHLSPTFDIPGSSLFESPAEAMNWFDSNHDVLLALLPDLIKREQFELCVTLAEAVVGLARYNGRHHDQESAAQYGLLAVNRLHWNAATTTAEDEQREQRHHLRMGVFGAWLGFARTSLGDVDNALKALANAEDHARRAHDEQAAATVLSVRAISYRTAGNAAAAEQEIRDALAIDLLFADPRRIAIRRRHLGNILSDQKRHDEAFGELHQAAVLFTGLGDPVGHACVLIDTATAMLAAGRPDESFAPLVNALDGLKDSAAPRYIARAYTQLARSSRATGTSAAANEYYADAATNYRLAHAHDTANAIEAEHVQMQLDDAGEQIRALAQKVQDQFGISALNAARIALEWHEVDNLTTVDEYADAIDHQQLNDSDYDTLDVVRFIAAQEGYTF